MSPTLSSIASPFRRLMQAKLFAASTALTLALGVAACTLITSLVSTILVKPLPYGNAPRLEMIWSYYPNLELGTPEQPTHGRMVAFIRDNIQSFERVAAFRGAAFNVGQGSTAERIDGAEVTGDFFSTLGIAPSRGRFFDRSNETPGSDRVIVISDGLWRRKFASDPSTIGKVISVNALPYVIIGVAPSGFGFPRGAEMPGSFQFAPQADMWVPLQPPNRGPSDLAVVGELRRGVDSRAGDADLARIGKLMESKFPPGVAHFQFEVIPLRRQVLGPIEPILLSLGGGVALVLLIACVNAAQLVLARLHAQQRSIAVRAALGASRRRIAGEILGEVSAISVVGGIAGVALGAAGLRLIATQAASRLPRASEVTFDVQSAILAIAVIVVAAVLAALLPMQYSGRISVMEVLRSGGRGQSDASSSLRLRRWLIVGELAGSVALLAAAGLLMQSLARQLQSERGFSTVHGMTFEVSLPATKYPEKQEATSMHHDASVQFLTAALEKLRATPGVEAAAIGKPLPLSGGEEATVFIPDGKLPHLTSTAVAPIAQFTVASPEMIRALGTPLLAGRDFENSDGEHAQRVVIINQALAEWIWPGEAAVGKRLRLGGPGPAPAEAWMTIVGVVANIKRYSLTEKPRPEMIVPYTQNPYPTFNPMQFVVRSRLSTASLAPALRAAIESVDPTLPIARVRTIDDLVATNSANARFVTGLMGGFSVLALLLAVVGVYGVTGYSVQQRRKEMGIRRALGAEAMDIARIVLSETVRTAGLGAAAGVVLACGAGFALRSILFSIAPVDVPTLVLASAVVLASALGATIAPLIVATRVEPRVALEE
jgi:putative ABC transport system permease protein